MEGHIQHTQVPGQHVPLQHLDWHEEWVLQQVTVEEKDSGHSRTQESKGGLGKGQHSLVHHAMADDDAAVV